MNTNITPAFHGSDLEKIAAYYHIPQESIINFGANVNPCLLYTSLYYKIPLVHFPFTNGEKQMCLREYDIRMSHLKITFGEGEVYKGNFIIESLSDGVIRGLVYPSSFRMRCIEQGFEGNPVKVNFEYEMCIRDRFHPPRHIRNIFLHNLRHQKCNFSSVFIIFAVLSYLNLISQHFIRRHKKNFPKVASPV